MTEKISEAVLEDIMNIVTPIQKDPSRVLYMTVVEYGPDESEKPVKAETIKVVEYGPDGLEKPVKAETIKVVEYGPDGSETSMKDQTIKTTYELNSLNVEAIVNAVETRQEAIDREKEAMRKTKTPKELAEMVLLKEETQSKKTRAAKTLAARVLEGMNRKNRVEAKMVLAAAILGTPSSSERRQKQTELATRVLAEEA